MSRRGVWPKLCPRKINLAAWWGGGEKGEGLETENPRRKLFLRLLERER